MVAEQPLLGLLAPHHPGRNDAHQAGQVPPSGFCVERGQDGLGEGVAHDDETVHLPGLDRVEQLTRAELASGEGHDLSALAQALHGGEGPGPVHERARGEQGHARPVGHQFGADLVDPPVGRVAPEAPAVEAGEEVVLAPHHALGHPGGPAGVEHVEVVGAATPGGPDPLVPARTAGSGRLGGLAVGNGPWRARCRPVVDPQPAAHRGDSVADALDSIHEGAVEDHGHRVGVLPQVHQLVVGVAVVGVDGDHADLVGGVGGLQVLRAVVEVQGQLVLLGHSRAEQPAADVVGAMVELPPGEGVAAVHEGRCLGHLLGHRLPHVGEVPLAHVGLLVPRSGPGSGRVRCLPLGRPPVAGGAPTPWHHRCDRCSLR